MELIKSHSAQLICACSWIGNIQSNWTQLFCGAWASWHANGCRDFSAAERKPAEGVWGNKEWHESMKEEWEAGWSWMFCLVEGRMEEGKGEGGSSESITQLSAGVMFNWINLLWNVQVLPGLMPCVLWRLGRRVGGWGSVGRLCHETGSEKANSPTGFESFIPSHPVTSVLLCLNLFLHPHIHHQDTRHVSVAHRH